MFARMALSNRLIIIIVAVNLLILLIVTILANLFSDVALREQAIERFDIKSSNAYQRINDRMDAFKDAADTITAWISEYESLNISTDVQQELVDLMQADDDVLINRVGILRPDNSVMIINIPDPMNVSQNARRVLDLENQLNNNNFDTARLDTNGLWFRQTIAAFDSQEQAAITYARAYDHSLGRGLIWFDISMPVFDAVMLDALNHEGLLFESNAAYYMIVDSNQIPIISYNLPYSRSEISRKTVQLFERYDDTDRSPDGLFHFADPFNADTIGLFEVQNLSANDWSFVTVLPENEIPVLPNNVFIPILLVGAFGLATLIFMVNRFIENDVVTPLLDLGRSASEIGDGNLRFVVFHLDKQDEIGRLANSMDNMKSRLRESYDALQKWNRTLEARVEERTIQLAEAREEAETTAEQLRVIYEESITVVNTSQLQPVLDAFIERILPLMDATYCAIWLLDNERETMRLVATNDARRRSSSDGVVTMHATDGIVGQAVRLDQAIIVNDYYNYEHRINLEDFYEDQGLPFNKAVCAPLKFAGFAIGGVVVGRPEEAENFGAKEERQLILFTNLVSPSVRNAQLFVRLQEAVQEAKRANEVKTRFLASVTHELRTPLNLIINNMDFMRVGAFGDVNEEQISRLNQTVRSAEHLLYLINDLLDVSKIEAGEMQLFIQKHEVYTMLEDAIDNAYALLDNDPSKAGHVELRVEVEDDLPELPMDARRIRQVLNNLLSNAIKFTEKGAITLKVYKEDTGVHFSVIDTGMGIPQDEMDKLFMAFERTSSAKQKAIEGTGLGLPISRYLVQQHGSDLTAVSEEGIGSTFAFSLPFESPENLGKMSLTDTQQITAILSSKNE